MLSRLILSISFSLVIFTFYGCLTDSTDKKEAGKQNCCIHQGLPGRFGDLESTERKNATGNSIMAEVPEGMKLIPGGRLLKDSTTTL